MDQALAHVQADLGNLRTGRASVQLVDTLKVEAYGTWMNLLELASINLPDSHLIVIKPYDRSILEAIEKAISKSDLNLQPIVDKDSVKLAIPSLTEERRKELVKILHQKLENGRVMVRNVRTETKKEIEQQKGSEGISEDDIHSEIEELEKRTKVILEKLEKMGEDKERELMTV